MSECVSSLTSARMSRLSDDGAILAPAFFVVSSLSLALKEQTKTLDTIIETFNKLSAALYIFVSDFEMSISDKETEM